jgi:hypothetical protein
MGSLSRYAGHRGCRQDVATPRKIVQVVRDRGRRSRVVLERCATLRSAMVLARLEELVRDAQRWVLLYGCLSLIPTCLGKGSS